MGNWDFPGGSDGKESIWKAEDLVLNPWLGSFPEKEMATHFGILAWRIPMDRGAWRAIVHGVSKSQTRLSTPQHKVLYPIGPPI